MSYPIVVYMIFLGQDVIEYISFKYFILIKNIYRIKLY